MGMFMKMSENIYSMVGVDLLDIWGLLCSLRDGISFPQDQILELPSALVLV